MIRLVDLRVYNRIKSQEGELTMFRYCFNAVDNKSGISRSLPQKMGIVYPATEVPGRSFLRVEKNWVWM